MNSVRSFLRSEEAREIEEEAEILAFDLRMHTIFTDRLFTKKGIDRGKST